MLLEQLLQPVLCCNSEFWVQCGAPGSLSVATAIRKDMHSLSPLPIHLGLG